METFSASYDRFDIGVGSDNRASGDAQKLHAEGSVADATNQCSWSFDLQVTETWTNTMGWMENLPNLQTYWYVGAMKARATGWIQWNNEYYEFENILGYQEKNWGDEFPETWYWLQANNFDSPDACCISVGGASMPIGPAICLMPAASAFAIKKNCTRSAFPNSLPESRQILSRGRGTSKGEREGTRL